MWRIKELEHEICCYIVIGLFWQGIWWLLVTVELSGCWNETRVCVGGSYGRTELAAELLKPSWQQNWVEMEKCFSDDGVTREPHVAEPHNVSPCSHGVSSVLTAAMLVEREQHRSHLCWPRQAQHCMLQRSPQLCRNGIILSMFWSYGGDFPNLHIG